MGVIQAVTALIISRESVVMAYLRLIQSELYVIDSGVYQLTAALTPTSIPLCYVLKQ